MKKIRKGDNGFSRMVKNWYKVQQKNGGSNIPNGYNFNGERV